MFVFASEAKIVVVLLSLFSLVFWCKCNKFICPLFFRVCVYIFLFLLRHSLHQITFNWNSTNRLICSYFLLLLFTIMRGYKLAGRKRKRKKKKLIYKQFTNVLVVWFWKWEEIVLVWRGNFLFFFLVVVQTAIFFEGSTRTLRKRTSSLINGRFLSISCETKRGKPKPRASGSRDGLWKFSHDGSGMKLSTMLQA